MHNDPRRDGPAFTNDLRTSKTDNTLYRIADGPELQRYFDITRNDGELEYDPTQRDNIQQAAYLYQCVMQYRNQINHASGPVQGLSQEGVLLLTSKDIDSTLTTTADFLESIRPYTPAIPDDVTPLLVDMRL